MTQRLDPPYHAITLCQTDSFSAFIMEVSVPLIVIITWFLIVHSLHWRLSDNLVRISLETLSAVCVSPQGLCFTWIYKTIYWILCRMWMTQSNFLPFRFTHLIYRFLLLFTQLPTLDGHSFFMASNADPGVDLLIVLNCHNRFNFFSFCDGSHSSRS